MKDVVIIGGGITGLATAFRLKHDHGIDALVLESEGRVGGKAHTDSEGGFTTEAGTNGWLDKEPAMRTLLAELALEPRIQPSDDAASHRFIFRNGRLYELHMHPLRFMTSSALPLTSRLRIALEPFIKKREDNDDETLASFAQRRLGAGARDLLIGPMASGVYAGDPARMSLRSCFPKVHALEIHHGGLIKGMVALKKAKKRAGEDPSTVEAGPSGRLTSLKGGVQDLVDALFDSVKESVRTGVTVRAIRPSHQGFLVESDGHEPVHTRAVVSAAPAFAAATYTESLDQDTSLALRSIEYPHLSVVCLGFSKPDVAHDVNGFGFLVPRGQGITSLGALWTSAIFPGRAPEDHVLIRTMIGGMLEPQTAKWTDEEIIHTVRRELETTMGIPASTSASFQKLYRHSRAIPQYHTGYQTHQYRIKEAEARHPGFFATGNALKGIGVIDCVRESVVTASAVARFIARP